jgi:hypothetical protein
LLALESSRGLVSIVPLGGGTPRQIVCPYFVWSGDERLLCSHRDSWVGVNVDGSDRVVLATSRRDGLLGGASSSSDGTLVAFGRRCWDTPIGGDEYCALAVVRADGSGLRTLIPYRRGDYGGPTGLNRPVWIPGTHHLLDVEWGSRARFADVDADNGAQRVVLIHDVGQPVAVRGDGTFAYLEPIGCCNAPPIVLKVVDPDGRMLVRRRVSAVPESADIYLG